MKEERMDETVNERNKDFNKQIKGCKTENVKTQC
jgi:hypothetical protein